MSAFKRRLYCCVCGAFAGKFEQWWNRDTGWGICARCAREQAAKLSEEEMRQFYGVDEVNYSQKENENGP